MARRWREYGGLAADVLSLATYWRRNKMSKCHYLKARQAGDEVYYWCELSDHPCTVEYDKETCEEWEEQKKEATLE